MTKTKFENVKIGEFFMTKTKEIFVKTEVHEHPGEWDSKVRLMCNAICLFNRYCENGDNVKFDNEEEVLIITQKDFINLMN